MIRKINSDTILGTNCRVSENITFGTNVKIGNNCEIGRNTILESVLIGDNCKIGDNVILRSVSIGNNCKVEDNSLIGYGTITGHYRDQKSHNDREHVKIDEYKITIGKNVLIRTGVTIYFEATIGNNCWINHNAIIREKARIDDDTSIGSNTIIENNVLIGKRCVIHNHTQVCDGTIIESYVFVGPNVTFTNNSPIGHLRDVPDTIQLTNLRLGCAIGAGATICPSIEIGQEAIVAAGAVVTKDVLPRTIVAGNPARKIKDVDAQSFIKKEIREQYGI